VWPAVLLANVMLVSALVAAAVTLVLRRLRGPTPAAVALVLGYAVGHCAASWPAFPPLDVTDRLPWIAAGAVAVDWVGRRLLPWVGHALAAVMTVGATVGPIDTTVARTWTFFAWAAMLCVGVAGTSAYLYMLARRWGPRMFAVLLSALALAAGAALTVSGSLVLGELCAALAAALLAAGLLARSESSSTALAVPFASLGGAVLIGGNIYSGLPTLPAVVLAASPLALWVACVPALARQPPWLRFAVVGMLAGMAAASAVRLAYFQAQP
jgi:hypothetical protein